MIKRLVIIVFVLLAAVLIFSRGPAYDVALGKFTEWFRKSWLALTTGKSEEG